MKTFQVISVEPIVKAKVRPFVGLTIVVNGVEERIARSFKQILLDLHNSGHALSIPDTLFDNGYDKANPQAREKVLKSLRRLIGKTGFADISIREIGDEYEATEISSKVVNGEAKVGDTLKVEKRHAVINDGFITFSPLSLQEEMRERMDSVSDISFMQAMFSTMEEEQAPTLVLPTPKVQDPKVINPETPENAFEHSAFGNDNGDE